MNNTVQYLDVVGALDVDVLQQTMSEADALRADFTVLAEEPRQSVREHDQWAPPVIDLRGEDRPVAAATVWMRQEVATAVDPAGGRLFHAAIARVDHNRSFLYQRVHHLLVDGYGAALIVRRTTQVYDALTEGDPATGNDVPASELGSLREVIAQDEEYEASDRFATDREFRSAVMTGEPTATMLARSGQPMAETFRQRTRHLDDAAATGMRSAARELGTSWSPLAIATVAAYLHRITGDADVVFGLPVAARHCCAARRRWCPTSCRCDCV